MIAFISNVPFEGAPFEAATPRERAPHFPGASFDVVGIASSAGGLTALTTVLSALPAGFAAAVVVVQHLDPHRRSLMADILARRTTLRVRQAEQDDRLVPATVYIAPPDRHLLVNQDGTLALSTAATLRFLRPSADLMFESLAAAYRDRAVGVVLSGTGTDGAIGVGSISRMGGAVIVQDDASAEFGGMPRAAIDTGRADFVLSLGEIASTLVGLVTGGSRRTA